MKFSANLSFLWKDLPLPDRVDAAARAGFEGVEILFPYDVPVPELDRALIRSGLPLVLINCPPPNYTGGARGFAAVAGAQDRFRHDFRRALRYANALRVQHLHIMSGEVADDRASRDQARAVMVDNLIWACAEAPRQSLTIEPINGQDMPGYFLDDYALAIGMISEVAAPNLGLQFDAYHAQRITGDALDAWERFGAGVRHIQIAGYPGRHEPLGGPDESGDIDYPRFFDRLAADGYDGWISAEYIPLGEVEQGLNWLKSACASRPD